MQAAGRALALLRGRSYVLPSDIAEVASDVMSHRMLLSFDAVADGADPRAIVAEVVAAVPQPSVATREKPDANRPRPPSTPEPTRILPPPSQPAPQ